MQRDEILVKYLNCCTHLRFAPQLSEKTLEKYAKLKKYYSKLLKEREE